LRGNIFKSHTITGVIIFICLFRWIYVALATKIPKAGKISARITCLLSDKNYD